MKYNKFLDEFFYYSSKVILLLPIIVIILSLVLKFNQKKEKNTAYENKKITITPVITSKSTPSPTSAKKNFSFNLQGPLVCHYNFNEASISAYIKNKNVYVEMVKKDNKENFLVNGDCLYSWKEKQYSGEKICGISQYINLATSLPFFDPSLIFSVIPLSNKNTSLITKNDFNQLISSCQKEKINDEIFAVPQAIIFKNNP